MVTVTTDVGVGLQLREWRERRRLTQLELALDAGVSTRHLSFVETGRSKPGRELLLRVAERLEIPFREQNQLLLAAGHAPAFPQCSLEDAALAPVRDALDRILSAHEPYPAVAFDRGWNVVAANGPMTALRGRRRRPGAARPAGQRSANRPSSAGARTVDRQPGLVACPLPRPARATARGHR